MTALQVLQVSALPPALRVWSPLPCFGYPAPRKHVRSCEKRHVTILQDPVFTTRHLATAKAASGTLPDVDSRQEAALQGALELYFQ